MGEKEQAVGRNNVTSRCRAPEYLKLLQARLYLSSDLGFKAFWPAGICIQQLPGVHGQSERRQRAALLRIPSSS